LLAGFCIACPSIPSFLPFVLRFYPDISWTLRRKERLLPFIRLLLILNPKSRKFPRSLPPLLPKANRLLARESLMIMLRRR